MAFMAFVMNNDIKRVLYWAVTIFVWIMIAMVIVSWIPPVRSSPVGDVLYLITSPILNPIRWVIMQAGLGAIGVDFSPIIAYFGLTYIQRQFLR